MYVMYGIVCVGVCSSLIAHCTLLIHRHTIHCGAQHTVVDSDEFGITEFDWNGNLFPYSAHNRIAGIQFDFSRFDSNSEIDFRLFVATDW